MPSTIPYTKLRGGKLYLNLPVPRDLREHFKTANGKPQTHIVEALGTGDPTEGRAVAKLREAHWVVQFAALKRKHRGELPSDLRHARDLRADMARAREEGNDDAEGVVLDLAEARAQVISKSSGPAAANQFWAIATRPDRMTLLQALTTMNESPDITAGTKAKREQVLRELLGHLKVPDCLPEFVTEQKAVGYVDKLNKGTLGYSTKQDRLSVLQTIWRFLVTKRQIDRAANPWLDHVFTGKRRSTVSGEGEKRGWKEGEILKLFAAQSSAPSPRTHYGRPLFRELYTLGFITGMRLDEIVSIRPGAVETIKGGYWINVEASKSEAGVRGVPVVHKAAVAILKRRLEAQRDPLVSIFPECRPGGPDNKLSWHVQKAMGRDRDRLGFGSEVDFHSTRRTFLTMMDNAGADIVHVQRYVGHKVNTMMHKVYSDGSSKDNLRKVAAAIKYRAEVEATFEKS